MTKKYTKIRVLYLVVATICLLFSGILYAWSILKAPFSAEFGWTNSQLATSYTLTISLFCIGCLVGGALIKKKGPKLPLIISAVLVFAGFALTSTLNGSSILLLYVYYALFAGFGIGIAYNTILASVGSWFPDKKGLASGIMMMGFGASALVFGSLAASLMNNESFGWRKVFLVFGICAGIMLLIMAFIVRMPKPEDELPKPNMSKKSSSESKSYTPKEILKRVSFWKFFIAMTLLGAVGGSLISFAKDFAMSIGTAAATAALLVGILSVANGLGRMIAGALYDKFGRVFVTKYICVIATVASALCVLAALTNSIILLVLGFIFVGLSYGANSNAVSVIITAFYGEEHYAQNLSLGLLTMLPSSFLGKLSTTLLNASGGYVVPFLVLIVFCLIATALHLTNKEA